MDETPSENPKTDTLSQSLQTNKETESGIILPSIVSYDANIDSLEDLTRIVQDCYQPSKDFFGEDISGIIIKLLYTRQEMNKALGRRTQDWVVGSAGRNKTIVIFSPAVFSKVSPHPTSEFTPVLTHEVAHIFTKELYQLKYPRWLSEGLSGYVAEQYKTRHFKSQVIQDFAEVYDSTGWNKTNPYNQAYSFTLYLIERFGRENMLTLLRSLSPKDSPSDFTGKFVDVFKCDFDACQTDWTKSLEGTQSSS